MKTRHSICFTMFLFLFFFTFACDSSTKKKDVEEPATAKTVMKDAAPLTARLEVTGGTIEGVEEKGLFIFKGIPFAAPPVNDLRWKAPAPVQPWPGVKKTDSYCDACMQAPNAMGNTAPVNEDCLYLNVWTPAKKIDEKLPVIYWIHGGGYSGGSTSTPMYDGAGLAEKGVVMVSVAYRLGPFGFLAHSELSRESGTGSGTYGMLDMIAGLKWVKENISRFGGDPSNVTIFGHSAGGSAVSLLAASPLTRGLFHRVICMSGGSFTPLQTSDQSAMGGMPSIEFAEQKGNEFIKKLGVDGIEAARELDALAIQQKLTDEMAGMRFHPVADGYFLSKDLYTLYEEGNFNDTPVLLGHTSNEMGSFGMNQNITPEQFKMQTQFQFSSYADTVLKAYPHSTNEEAVKASMDMGNDRSFSWNTWAWSSLQSSYGKGKAYQYYFDYNPESPGTGVGHGSDVPYAFRTLDGSADPQAEQNRKLSDMISSYWVNFAKSGNPNEPGLPQWPAFTKDDPKVMIFDRTTEAAPLPILNRLKVIDGYFASLREKNQKP